MKAKFTPGPWGKEYSESQDMWEIAPLVPDESGIGTYLDWDNEIASTADGSEANANLLLAAPDLYEALDEAVRMYGQNGGPWNVPSHPGSWISQARAALAKARGEVTA